MASAKKAKSKKAHAAGPQRTPVTGISPDEQIVGAPFLGKVRAYDPRRGEMTIVLEEPVSNGDALRVKGRETDLSQRVERLCVGKSCVQSALSGETVVVAVADRVRVGDAVYKVRTP
ncbi:MAG: hypothetical protein M0D55_11210 [Elusimicrobiota bacterium]|nr:MAG: hypothetical protein M0D55_11210 [Elusimicrobiota bacterium]